MQSKSPVLFLGTSLGAAVGAAACCLLPLVLVTAGLGGAWLSTLRVLEPARPLFILAAVMALAVAYWQIFRKPEPCDSDQACANPVVQKRRRYLFWVVSVLVVALLTGQHLCYYLDQSV